MLTVIQKWPLAFFFLHFPGFEVMAMKKLERERVDVDWQAVMGVGHRVSACGSPVVGLVVRVDPRPEVSASQ